MRSANEVTRAQLMQQTYVGRHGETNFTNYLIDLAQVNGWRAMHISDSRKMEGRKGHERLVGDALCKGWPDLVVVRGARMVIRELKVENRQPTPEQREWLKALAEVREVDVGVWWPRDWDAICDLLEGRG